MEIKKVLFVCAHNSVRSRIAEVCPASFVPTEDWELDDPEGKPIEKVRQIRDEIEAKVDELARMLL